MAIMSDFFSSKAMRVALAGVLTCAALSACGGSSDAIDSSNTGVVPSPGLTPAPATVTVSLAGLAAGSVVTLVDQDGRVIVVSTDGTFDLSAASTSGSTLSLTVMTQPAGQYCQFQTANGASTAANSLSNLSLSCASLAKFSGTTAGLLAGVSLMMQDQNGTRTAIAANGPFEIVVPGALLPASSYSLTLATQPVGQYCRFDDGTTAGTQTVHSLQSLSILCVPVPVFTGTVSGLANGGSITVEDQSGLRGAITSNGSFARPVNDPSLPAGSYSLTIVAQPSGQTCGFQSGSSTSTVARQLSGLAIVCMAPTTPPLDMLYVTDGPMIHQLEIAADGTLSAVAPMARGTTDGRNTTGIAVDSSRQYAYAINFNENTLTLFRVARDGSLSPLTATRPSTGAGPQAVAAHPVLPALYVANGSEQTMSQYTIDPATGLLTEGPKLATGTAPSAIGILPSGRAVYTTNWYPFPGFSTLSQFGVDTTTGLLSPLNPALVYTSRGPIPIVVGTSGLNAWVGFTYDSSIIPFKVDTTNGAISEFTFPINIGFGTRELVQITALAVDSASTYLYAAVTDGLASPFVRWLYQFPLNPDGTVSQWTSGGTRVDVTSCSAVNLAMDASGRFLYVPCAGLGTVKIFAPTPGTLTEVGSYALAVRDVTRPSQPSNVYRVKLR